jgi:hypothetical protein
MRKKRHTPEEIVAKLRQVDGLVAQGTPVVDAIRSIGVTAVGFGTSCWTGRSSTYSERRRSSSRAGGDTTTACARMPLSATAPGSGGVRARLRLAGCATPTRSGPPSGADQADLGGLFTFRRDHLTTGDDLKPSGIKPIV